MDILFSDFKKKDVIDVCSGKKLGKVKDMLFTFPDGKIKSITVSTNKLWGGEEEVIPYGKIERVGEDALLVNTARTEPSCDGKPPLKKPCPPQKGCPPKPQGGEDRRGFFDDDYE